MAARYRVLVTSRSFGAISREPYEILERHGCDPVVMRVDKAMGPGELAKYIKGFDGLIVGRDTVDRAAIDAADRLKVICMHGVGLDQIDVEYAKRKQITVANVPGTNAQAVAELVVAFMLCLARSVLVADRTTRNQEWRCFIGTELAGKTLGLIGVGNIGRNVARYASALGMKAIAHDIVRDERLVREGLLSYEDREFVIRNADFLSLHVPLTPATKDMIGPQELAMMKQTAYLINTSRGGIVDEEALYEALITGVIAGAALDVFVQEPPGPDNPLLKLENCLVTPHMGARTRESANRTSILAAQRVVAALTGSIDREN